MTWPKLSTTTCSVSAISVFMSWSIITTVVPSCGDGAADIVRPSPASRWGSCRRRGSSSSSSLARRRARGQLDLLLHAEGQTDDLAVAKFLKAAGTRSARRRSSSVSASSSRSGIFRDRAPPRALPIASRAWAPSLMFSSTVMPPEERDVLEGTGDAEPGADGNAGQAKRGRRHHRERAPALGR